MNEHLFKLKKDGKTVGYLRLNDKIWWKINRSWIEIDPQEGCSEFFEDDNGWDTAHPFVTKDKNGKDVFARDEVLVYRGRENIGEGHIFFNDRFLWWTVNNSSQDNDRGYPQDWSQLTLCDVDIELIEDKENE
jgi:hypothetical protein